ncbi:ABC transporter permease [Planctomycetota bacterium]
MLQNTIKWTLCLLAFAVAIAFILLPVIAMVGGTLWSDGGLNLQIFSKVFGKSYQKTLLINTLSVSTLATLMAGTFALVLAVLLGRTDIPFRRLLSTLALLPVVIPPYILALTWVFLIGNNGMLVGPVKALLGIDENPFFLYGRIGSAFIMAMSYFPLIFLLTQAALQWVDGNAEEAGRFSLSRWGVFRHITLRWIMPTFLVGLLFVFVITLMTFDIPAFLQVNVYAIQIMSEFNYTYDYKTAMALAMPLVGVGILLVVVIRTFLVKKTFSTESGDNDKPLFEFGRFNRAAALLPMVFVGISSVLPFYVLIKMSGSWQTYEVLFRSAGGNFLIGLQTAAVAALIMCAVGIILAYWSLRASPGWRWLVDISYLAAFALPPTLVGVGLIAVYNHVGYWQYFYRSYWIIVAADIARFLPFSVLILRSAMRKIPRSSDEAADCCGLGWAHKFYYVYLLQMKRPLLNAFVICLLFSLGELAAVQMVAPPGGTTLPMRMFTILHYGQDHLVAAMAVMMMIFAAVLFFMYYLFTSRRPELL